MDKTNKFKRIRENDRHGSNTAELISGVSVLACQDGLDLISSFNYTFMSPLNSFVPVALYYLVE